MQSIKYLKTFDITVKTDKTRSFRVEKLVGMFDLKDEHLVQNFKGEIVLPDKWSVGAIVGRSGTGKSVISSTLFEIYKAQYSDQPVIDEMPQDKTVEEITKTFTQVGFSSPPHWLKPYQSLSNGEKMRVDLAKALLENKSPICFDEFTSVVDRDVAKVVSRVISKAVKELDKQFIAVSCHYDILSHLDADWVFSTDSMQMLNIDALKKKGFWTSLYPEDAMKTGLPLKTITI